MKKGKLGWKPQLVLLLVIIALIVVVVVKLVKWNSQTVELEKVDEGTYDTESLDLAFHIDKDILEAHGDDGVKRMLVMGNYGITKTIDGTSVLQKVKEGMPDWQIDDICASQSLVTAPTYMSDDEFPGGHYWSPFTLYYLIKGMCTRDYANQEYNYLETGCFTHEDPEEYMKKYEAIDLNDYDTLLIMYASSDYYQMQTLYNDADEFDVTTYMGALKSALKLVTETYPHLRVVVSSPYLTYSEWDGKIELGTLVNFGSGTESEYVMREYTVCTEYCISFIDNYFSYITEKNYEKYVNFQQLTADGVTAVSNHIIEFLSE